MVSYGLFRHMWFYTGSNNSLIPYGARIWMFHMMWPSGIDRASTCGYYASIKLTKEHVVRVQERAKCGTFDIYRTRRANNPNNPCNPNFPYDASH